jgi:hypothetical protein
MKDLDSSHVKNDELMSRTEILQQTLNDALTENERLKVIAHYRQDGS